MNECCQIYEKAKLISKKGAGFKDFKFCPECGCRLSNYQEQKEECCCKEKTSFVTATKIFTFDAAHYLEGHPGACRRMHGHTYKLEITFQKNSKMPVSEMNPPDMVMDFSHLKTVVEKYIISKVDHQIINEIPEWQMTNLRPTAENMVEVFAKWLMKADDGLYSECLVSIRLWETPTSYATWTK